MALMATNLIVAKCHAFWFILCFLRFRGLHLRGLAFHEVTIANWFAPFSKNVSIQSTFIRHSMAKKHLGFSKTKASNKALSTAAFNSFRARVQRGPLS